MGSRSVLTESVATPQRPGRRFAVALLLVLSICYCVAELVPGRFAATDEVYFKAAGRNWAATGHFAAPEMKGFLDLNPPLSEVFFPYPPLYPFLFGLYTKVAGFGPRSCILYDVFIHLALVWVAFGVAKRVFGLPWHISATCGALLIPLGTVGRPDELGIVMAFSAALSLTIKAKPTARNLLAGLFMGLCGLASLGAAIFLGPLVVWEGVGRQPTLRKRVLDFLFIVVIAVTFALICVTPLLVLHPGAYRQLFSIAILGSSANRFLHGYTPAAGRPTFAQAWVSALYYGYPYFALVGLLVAFSFACGCLDRERRSADYSRILLAMLSLALVEAAMPGKYTYLWFAACWLLLACVALGWRVLQSLVPSGRRLLLVFSAIGCLGLCAPYLRWKLILWTLPAEQSLNASVNRVREDIPADVGVLSTEYWWALAGRDQLYDNTFSNPGDAVDYVVVTGVGSAKPGVPILDKKYSDWQVVDSALRLSRPSVLGLPLSRSAYGFGPYILKRKSSTSVPAGQ